jgi:hypothetical protein
MGPSLRTFRRYSPPAPDGSLVIRMVRSGNEAFGFIREVQDDERDDVYPTEQQPIENVWRLLDGKLESDPTRPVFVELEAGLEWRSEWGRLSD